jgi:hypothetical protein
VFLINKRDAGTTVDMVVVNRCETRSEKDENRKVGSCWTESKRSEVCAHFPAQSLSKKPLFSSPST